MKTKQIVSMALLIATPALASSPEERQAIFSTENLRKAVRMENCTACALSASDIANAPIPLSLEQAIELALGNNPGLRSGEESVKAAKAGATAAWLAGFTPTITVSKTLQSQLTDTMGHMDSKDLGVFNWSARVTLFNGFKNFFDGKAASAGVGTLAEQLRGAKNSLAAQTGGAYVQLVLAQARKKSMEFFQESLKAAMQKFPSEDDRKQIELELSDIDGKINETELAIQASRGVLSKLTGISHPVPTNTVEDFVEKLITVPASVDDALQIASKESPAIRSATRAIDKAVNGRRSAWASVAGELSYGTSSTRTDMGPLWSNTQGRGFTYAVGFNAAMIPAIKGAHHGVNAAREKREGTVRDIVESVQSAYKALDTHRRGFDLGTTAAGQGYATYHDLMARPEGDPALTPVAIVETVRAMEKGYMKMWENGMGILGKRLEINGTLGSLAKK